MHRGRLIVGVLGAGCLVGCEWLAGIDGDLTLAEDVDSGVAKHDGGDDAAGATASMDGADDGADADRGEPAEEASPDAQDVVPVDASHDVEDAVAADTGGLPDSAGPADSAQPHDAASDVSLGPLDAGPDGALDTPPDAPCACGALSVCVSGRCTPGLRVFVTNETYNGALGGHLGADSTCQMLAVGAGLGGTWMAWISDSTSSPSQRFAASTLGYYLLDGTLVAATWADLTKSGPAHPIAVTETGISLAGASIDASKTWTGTLTSGAIGTPSCNDFDSYAVAYAGEVGHCTGTGTVNWTSGYTSELCDVPNHLYCFEQDFVDP